MYDKSNDVIVLMQFQMRQDLVNGCYKHEEKSAKSNVQYCNAKLLQNVTWVWRMFWHTYSTVEKVQQRSYFISKLLRKTLKILLQTVAKFYVNECHKVFLIN